MAAQSTRRRGSATPPARRTIRASLVVDDDLHRRWGVAASYSGQDRNAFAVEMLRQATKHIIIIDRTKKVADPGQSADAVQSDDEVDRPDGGT